MFQYVILKGVQYAGETTEQMEARGAAMEAHNRKVVAQYEDWKRQQRTPMDSMILWARERGMLNEDNTLIDDDKAFAQAERGCE